MTAPQNDAVRTVLRVLDSDGMDILYDWIQSTAVDAAQDSVASDVTASEAAGVTSELNGRQTRGLLKVTVAKEAFTAAAQAEAVVLATLPAKARVVSCVVDVTEGFVLDAAAMTLEVGVDDGDTPDPDALIVSAAVGTDDTQLGLADADLGAGLAAATAVQGGTVPNWAGTADVTLTLTSDDEDLGDGDVTALTAGSVTIYLVVELMP